MSGVLKFVGKVAGVVAFLAITAATLGSGGAAMAPLLMTIAGYAGAASAIANIGAALTAKKPPILGGTTDITIGADQPSPYLIGETYYGGALQHQVGYGPTIDDTPNPYAAWVTVYSVAGPIESIVEYQADFVTVSFGGGAEPVEASGYFDNILFRDHQLGAVPESSALTGPWGAIPDWGGDYKISGKAAILWSAKWDSKNGKYQSGAPQWGAILRGVKSWDPREDDTWPGGAGAHRWADPRTDKTGHDAARATWTWSAGNVGVEALNYALGRWERKVSDPDSIYTLVMGVGLPIDAIVVDDFIQLANISEANGWTCHGVVFEPGDKYANLKRILEAAGAEPCPKGGRLGLKLSTPRVPVATITRADLDGPMRAAGGQAWEQAVNTGIPKCVSPAHKWTMQQSTTEVSVPDAVAMHGEIKRREFPWQMVKDMNQAAQLTVLKLWDGLEQGPIEIAVGPRLRGVQPGQVVTIDDEVNADLGLLQTDLVVLKKRLDPLQMSWTLTCATETAQKYEDALAATGAVPGAVTIPTTEARDGVLLPWSPADEYWGGTAGDVEVRQ